MEGWYILSNLNKNKYNVVSNWNLSRQFQFKIKPYNYSNPGLLKFSNSLIVFLFSCLHIHVFKKYIKLHFSLIRNTKKHVHVFFLFIIFSKCVVHGDIDLDYLFYGDYTDVDTGDCSDHDVPLTLSKIANTVSCPVNSQVT